MNLVSATDTEAGAVGDVEDVGAALALKPPPDPMAASVTASNHECN